MSYSRNEEDWLNGPGVTIVKPGPLHVRDHYCVARKAEIGLRVNGMHEAADIFCPLCGVLATADFTNHRYDGPWLADIIGPKCKHGKPDQRCIDLAEDCESAVYDLRFSATIREFRGEILSLAGDARELGEIATGLEAARARDRETDAGLRRGFVYLIAGGDAVKIGFSEKHPGVGRLSQLQTASAHELQIAGLIVGTEADERDLHVRFAKHRIRGEWFRRCEEIEAYFSERSLAL